MRAEERDLDYIRDMQIVTNVSKYAQGGHGGGHGGGDPILVAYGAHYSKRMVPREDILLHILKEVKSTEPAKQYSIVCVIQSRLSLPLSLSLSFDE